MTRFLSSKKEFLGENWMTPEIPLELGEWDPAILSVTLRTLVIDGGLTVKSPSSRGSTLLVILAGPVNCYLALFSRLRELLYQTRNVHYPQNQNQSNSLIKLKMSYTLYGFAMSSCT